MDLFDVLFTRKLTKQSVDGEIQNLRDGVPASASVSSGGEAVFENQNGEALFSVQLPNYDEQEQIDAINSSLEGALLYRGALSAGGDMDELTQIGVYYVQPSYNVANLPVNHSGRIFCLSPKNTDYSRIQLFADCVDSSLYYRTKHLSTSSFSAWEKIASTDDLVGAVMFRRNLSAQDDLNSLTEPGVYFKTGGVTVSNGVNNRMARVICYGSPGFVTAILQIWADCANKNMYFRIRGLVSDDASAGWSSWQRVATDTEISELRDAMTYTIDPATFGWSFGGVQTNGANNNADTRLRMLGADGESGILVKAGSTITANTGYKFSAALYSKYRSAADYVKLGYRGMATGSYTVPVDCYIRISVATTDEAVLWTKDDEGRCALTEEGTLAEENALTLNLIGGTIKTAVSSLADRINRLCSEVQELPNDIPLNAADYYALWNEMVSAGFALRTKLGVTDGNEPLPIYQYSVRSNMRHVAPGYGVVDWNGSNELYTRPKILLLAGQHGNERTPPVALWDFAMRLWRDPSYQSMRDAFDWYFIPLVNPWGFGHTALKNSVVNNGNGYKASTVSTYTVEENTATRHQGIRCNLSGADINRDYGTSSSTPEAQAVRNALNALTADGAAPLLLLIDCHQATGNADAVTETGARCAFLSLQYGASAMQKTAIYKRFMQAAAQTMSALAVWRDVDADVQTMYPWEGTNLQTLRNYGAGFAAYSTCYEGGQNCTFYSGLTGISNWSNPVCRAVVNTQLHNTLRQFAKLGDRAAASTVQTTLKLEL